MIEFVINKGTVRIRFGRYGFTSYPPGYVNPKKRFSFFTYPAKTRRELEERDRKRAEGDIRVRQAIEKSLARAKAS